MPKRRGAATLTKHTTEAVKAKEAARVSTVLPPWLGWIAALGVAITLHRLWPYRWAAEACLGLGLALAAHAVYLTHHRRRKLARFAGAATILAAAAWLAWATLEGITPNVGAAWFMGGGALALAWSMWLHIHGNSDESGLGRWFAEASEHTATPGVKLRVTKMAANKITGVLRHPPGTTTADVVKAVAEHESALDVPLGTLQVTEHPATARASKVAFVNPRTLDTPRLWPGASRAAASAADPLRLGRFADMTDWEITIFPRDLPGYQLLIMGMTGAAKTTGLGYCFLGEAITRHDLATLAMDPVKGLQFLGCMRPALNHLAITHADCRKMFWRVHNAIRPRTDYLGNLGLQKWEQGCGLTGVLLWVEEASKVFSTLGDNDVEEWVLPAVLAARSAGIFIVLSLQRASYDQIPPSIRAQLASICMGVRESGDAAFGLSDQQQEHGCNPGKWSNEKPGMAYSAVPTIPEDYRYMEARADYWGSTSAMMAAHAAAWPVDRRDPMDPLTAAHLFPPDEVPVVSPAAAQRRARPQPAAAPPEDAVRHDPPTDEELDGPPAPTGYDDPELWRETEEETDTETPEGLPPGAVDFRFGQPAPDPPAVRMTPEAAREKLRERVQHWANQGKTEITREDLADLTDPRSPTYIDRVPTWLYGAMTELVAAGLLEQHDRPRRWTIRKAA
jgi:hypothetical protein